VSQIRAESDEILTNTIVIQFFPNSSDIYKKINKEENGQVTEVLYDPNIDNVLSYAQREAIVRGYASKAGFAAVGLAAVRA